MDRPPRLEPVAALSLVMHVRPYLHWLSDNSLATKMIFRRPVL